MRRRANLALVVLFVGGIVAPGVGTIFAVQTGGMPGENRPMAPVPKLADGVRLVRRQIDAWFDDHFGFRNSLVQLHSRIAYGVFGVSSTRDVVLGRDGWLFYVADRIPEDHLGLLPFGEAELAAWQARIEERRDWLAARGIRYVFALAPEKSSLYGEQLPAWMQPRGERTRADQLFAWMRAHSTVPILDFRPALAAAKDGDRLYHRTDTHWNDVGAFVAYREVATWLARELPAVRPLDAAAFERQVHVGGPGDLGGMLGLTATLAEERLVLVPTTAPALEPRAATARMLRRPHVPTSAPRVFACASGEVARAVVVHDSFFEMVMPFLARHFRRSAFIRTFATEVIEEERPDVVIEEMVERMLSRPGDLPASEIAAASSARP